MKRSVTVFLVFCISYIAFSITAKGLPPDLNLARGGPESTNPLAIPVQITGVNADPYNTDMTDWTGNWEAPQAIYDQGTYMDDPDFWSNIAGNVDAGTTWYNPQPGTGYGILVIDLQGMTNILNISVFQMFSDGKITQIALAGHAETGNTPPDALGAGWSEFLPVSLVGPGTDHGSYVSGPTKFTVDATTRYVKIMAYNDGSYGSGSYIELKGIKMFGELGDQTEPSPEPSPVPLSHLGIMLAVLGMGVLTLVFARRVL